ncbi:uncharacterized protein EKO05_0005554 [Ascochyta rabiei]|uniref:uncharacterized protein n=1 Tax=Didymella rabiei TaxID=5454 RepID=UPI001901DB5C|nr:uncharacterized protein EKO05_0005554 [Ascochyta rabiei]UPX15091.1 hypothetical protein EKO05_0005554 [Ascochyta rabiei]
MANETDPELALLFEAYTELLKEELLLQPGQLKQALDALPEKKRPISAERINPWKLYNGENDGDEEVLQKEETAQEEDDGPGEEDEECRPSEHSNCEHVDAGNANSDNEDGSNRDRDNNHSEAEMMEPELSEVETTDGAPDTSHPQRWKRPMYSRQRYEICANCEEEYDVTLNRNNSCRYHAGGLFLNFGLECWREAICEGEIEDCGDIEDAAENRRKHAGGCNYSCCWCPAPCMVGGHRPHKSKRLCNS